MTDFGACHGRNHQIFILKLIILLVQLGSNSFSKWLETILHMNANIAVCDKPAVS